MAETKDHNLTELPFPPATEPLPHYSELDERRSWIAEADKAIAMLGLKPLTVYIEMYGTDEPSLENDAKQSHHCINARQCLDETCPEIVLKECLLDAFHNFRNIMESQAAQLMQGKPINPANK